MGKVSRDTGDKKEPPSSGSQPQTRKSSVSKDVNITKYLDSRAAELAHFESILQNKFKESTRTPMQTVPKHMRRRAMSHNRFRIPSRIRALNAKYMKDSEKKILRNRKHARNNKLVLLHYFKRGFRAAMKNKQSVPVTEVEDELHPTEQFGLPRFLRCRWLETHMWHARRMGMAEYCGCKIAQFSRQKAMKRSRVGALAGVAAYDHSYMSLIQVIGVSTPSDLIRQLCSKMVRGTWEEGVLEVEVDSRLGHATIIKSSDTSFVLLVDPAVQEELANKIESVIQNGSGEIKVLNDLLNVFELFGPQSLRTVVRSMQGDITNLPERASGYDGLGLAPTHLKFGFIGGFSCKYFSTNRARDITHKTSIGFAEQTMIDEGELTPPLVVDWPLEENLGFGNWLRQQTTLEGFWTKVTKEIEMDHIMARFLESRRGQYSHKRTKFNPDAVKESVPAQKPNFAAQTAANSRKTPQQSQKLDSSASQDLKKRITLLKQSEFQILLINLSTRHKGVNKILALVPSGFGLRFWRRLNQFGARALGFKEYIHVGHQLLQRMYPVDYPESLQFHEFEKGYTTKIQDKYFRRPPAKRPNHLKLNSPFPFTVSLGDLSKHFPDSRAINCTLRSLRTGVPHERGYICFPLESDLQILLKAFTVSGVSAGNNLLDKILNNECNLLIESVGSVDDESQLSPNPHRHRERYLDLVQQRGFTGSSREIVGRITSGFLEHRSAKGFGFASVFEQELEKLETISGTLRSLSTAQHLGLREGSCLALFRNTNSVHYFYCILTRE